MKTKTIETAFQRIQESAKSMPEARVVELEIGQVARQGDIYIERVASIQNKGKQVKSRQLAPGNTKGSRHIVDESPSLTLWESSPTLTNGKASFQAGCAIEAKGGFSITHPEHAWIKFAVKGVQFFQVFFQADPMRKARAKD